MIRKVTAEKAAKAVVTLRAALKLLDGGKNWVKGTYFAKSKRRAEYANMAEAKCFCSVGAVRKVSDDKMRLKVTAYKFLDEAADVVFGVPDTICGNDKSSTRFPQVEKMFKLAIKNARKVATA